MQEHAERGQQAERKRRRIRLLFEMAKAYRGESQEELARRLGRNHDRLIPESGNPKLDVVVGLSHALEWPVALVISFIWGEETKDECVIEGDVGDDFESLQLASRA